MESGLILIRNTIGIRTHLTPAETELLKKTYEHAIETQVLHSSIRLKSRIRIRWKDTACYSFLIPMRTEAWTDLRLWGPVIVNVYSVEDRLLATCTFEDLGPGGSIRVEIESMLSRRLTTDPESLKWEIDGVSLMNLTRRYPIDREQSHEFELSCGFLLPSDLREFLWTVSHEEAKELSLNPLSLNSLIQPEASGGPTYFDLTYLAGKEASLLVPLTPIGDAAGRSSTATVWLADHRNGTLEPFAEGVRESLVRAQTFKN
jgi:hypothetical protein